MTRGRYVLPATLIVAGIGAMAIVATINGVYAARFGTDALDTVVSVGSASVIDIGTMLMAAVVGTTLALRKWVTAFLAGLVCCAFLLLSGGTAAGYMGLKRMAPAEAARINAQLKVEAANQARDMLGKQADFFQQQIATSKRGDRQMFLDESRASILSMMHVPKLTAEEAMPDPMGALFAKITGLDPSSVQAVFITTLTAALVLSKVLFVGFGSYLWPRSPSPDRGRATVDRGGRNGRTANDNVTADAIAEDMDFFDDEPVEKTRATVAAPTVAVVEPTVVEPITVTEKMTALIKSRDSVGDFLLHREALGLPRKVYGPQLYGEYCDWCEDEGIQPRDYRYFAQRLDELGAQKTRIPETGRGVCYALPYHTDTDEEDASEALAA